MCEQQSRKYRRFSEEKDAQFIVDAAEINREEISLRQSAQQKGSKSQVKESGKVMVRGHKDAIAIFAKALTDCIDPDIKVWETAALPALRTHLDHSLMCQKQCEKM